VIGEHRLEMRDPVGAFTGLAIGDAQQAPTERRAHGHEHLVRIGERDTADEVDVARRHRVHPTLAARNRISGKAAQSR